MINIVIPMAGLGSRFAIARYEKPKPFIDVLGIPMIQRVMMNLELEDSRFILIARKEHLEKEKEIVNKIQEIYTKYNIKSPPDSCLNCEFKDQCGGGYYPTRFSSINNSLNNSSVYCTGLFSFFNDLFY